MRPTRKVTADPLHEVSDDLLEIGEVGHEAACECNIFSRRGIGMLWGREEAGPR